VWALPRDHLTVATSLAAADPTDLVTYSQQAPYRLAQQQAVGKIADGQRRDDEGARTAQ
jgi:hypothetical protein